MSEIKRNFVPITSIFIPKEEDARIREQDSIKKAVVDRMKSIRAHGQLQPILVEKLDRTEHPEAPKECIWKLIDGQVRMLSIHALSIQIELGDKEISTDFERWGLKPGYIEISPRDAHDPIQSLMMEFHANEDRDDFSWEEKGRYIRRIHDMLQEKFGRKEWTATKTADYIGQSLATVSHYLQLTDDKNPATKDERVVTAKTKRAAIKQLKIVEDQRRRLEAVLRQQESDAKAAAKGKSPKTLDYVEAAKKSIYHGDAREWIKTIPDNSLAWFHWDPPYGGKEGSGGAFASEEAIDTDTEYCLSLMRDMIPEIWRVLQDGSWFVIWYTPVHYNWLRLTLQGHNFSDEGTCEYCNRNIHQDYIWLAENYICRPSPHRFWVNPYPNYWRKTDRHADGHEIQRFLTKETEPFLLVGKQFDRNPILLRSDRGNVFDFPGVSRSDRRHVNHKPPELLAEILSLISVPGDLGGDAGLGSGSIIEAAYNIAGRKVIGAEIRERHYKDSLATAVESLKEKNYGPKKVAPWF